MGVGASSSVMVRHIYLDRSAVVNDATFNLRHRTRMIAVGFVGSNGDGLVWSPDALRTRAECATIWLIVGRDKIVHAINLIHVMSFAYACSLRNNLAVGTWYWFAKVGL